MATSAIVSHSSAVVSHSSAVVSHAAAPAHVSAAAARRAAAPRLMLLDEAKGAASVKQREAALIEWLAANGVWVSPESSWGRAAHPLRVESETTDDFEPSGRGLIARKQTTQGEAVLQIPMRLVMTKEKAVKELGAELIEPLGEYIALALLLVHERAKGDASMWAPYIDLLPSTEEVGQSFTWGEEELALLQGSPVVESTRSFQAKLRAEYETVQQLSSAYPQVLPSDVHTWEAFEWAMSMLFSRGINLREIETLALVPYADLINHSPYAQTFFMLGSIPLSSEKEVVLYGDRAYARNDQVLVSYGQKSNQELLLLYGFVIDRNLFDQVDLRVAVDPSDPRYDEKAAFLRSQGLNTEMAFPLLIDRYSSELMEFLRLCCLRASDASNLESLSYNEPISIANEKAALTALRDGCLAALDEYPQSEEEDAQLMSDGFMFLALSRNMRMAVKLRRNEKRILLRTVRVCEEGLGKLQARGTEGAF